MELKKVLVIIPVYNEEKNIENVVAELRKDLSFAEILVVNDCSTDYTLEKLKKINVKYISLPFNMGYSSALQVGFKYAINNNYEYAIQFDGDGQHIALEAVNLYDFLLKEKVDIVIGSRFKNLTDYKHSIFRKLGTNIFKFMIKRLCKIDITDPTSGFQVLNNQVLRKYAKMSNYPEFPDANLIIDMLFEGYKIKEYPVKMRGRKFGISMHSGIIKPMKYMIKMFYSISLLMIKYFNNKKIKHGKNKLWGYKEC